MGTSSNIFLVACTVIISVIIFYIIISRHMTKDLETYILCSNPPLKLLNLNFVPAQNSKISKYGSFMNAADNGDLVFFCGDSTGERSCRWVSGSMYSHVGLLFKEPCPKTNKDILYIWESDLGQKTKEGPRVMKFVDKLEKYHGQPYFAWRKLVCYDKYKPTTEKILKVIDKYKNYKFDDKMLTWFFGGGGIFYNLLKDDKSFFCSELVAKTLQSKILGILKRPDQGGHLPAYYSPESFVKENIAGLKTEKYTYAKCEYIKNTLSKKITGLTNSATL